MFWAQNYLTFALVLVGMLSLGMRGLIPAATAAVVPWFVVKRSIAMAASNTGWSVGAASIPPLIGVGVATVGWRTTVVILAVVVWVVMIPLSRVFRPTPASTGLPPDGIETNQLEQRPGNANSPTVLAEPPPEREMDLHGALRSRYLWLISLSMSFHGMVISAVSVHMVAIMTWRGVPETTAGYLVGVWAAFMAPMILIMGWMGDRWPKTRVSSAGLFLRAIGWFLMLTWVDGTVWRMVLVLLLLSPDFGIFSLSGAIIADWVGRRHYATIRGTMQSISGVMGMGAPLYAGWVFDATDSYTMVVLPALVLTIVSGTLFWLIPRPKETRPADDVSESGSD